MVLKDKEEVFHQAEATDRNDQRRNQPSDETEAPLHHPAQGSHLFIVERADVHRAGVLLERVTHHRP